MKDVKLICTTLLLILLYLSLGAQNTYLDPENTMHPIANVDDVFTPYVNPSLLGSSFAHGLGFGTSSDEEDSYKQHWLFIAPGDFAYTYENRNDVSYHSLSSGGPLGEGAIFRNIHIGSRYSWKNSKFSEGWLRSGVTLRPHNSLSLAMVWDNPYKQAPLYTFGAAARPLEFVNPNWGHRLELSADIDYNRDPLDATAKREFKNPLLGINTEVLNGLKIGAFYDLDSKNAFSTSLITFSISVRCSFLVG